MDYHCHDISWSSHSLFESSDLWVSRCYAGLPQWPRKWRHHEASPAAWEAQVDRKLRWHCPGGRGALGFSRERRVAKEQLGWLKEEVLNKQNETEKTMRQNEDAIVLAGWMVWSVERLFFHPDEAHEVATNQLGLRWFMLVHKLSQGGDLIHRKGHSEEISATTVMYLLRCIWSQNEQTYNRWCQDMPGISSTPCVCRRFLPNSTVTEMDLMCSGHPCDKGKHRKSLQPD